jgi:hypothetical protein
MTSLKQIGANRRNALKSTGPTSANGKDRARRNALRHGFTAETVLEPLENPWATSIETGLLRMQAEILEAFRSSRQRRLETREEGALSGSGEMDPEAQPETRTNDAGERDSKGRWSCVRSTSRDIALSYLRLANLDNELIDRLSRYEGGLWRQTVQTLFALQALKRRYPR